MNGQTVSTRVVLIEMAELKEAAGLAIELARAGHSIGLAFREKAESTVNELQVKLERTGGISFAISLDAAGIERAIGMMIDAFGRLDEIACFTKETAGAAEEAAAKIPSKQRPRVVDKNA